VQGHKFVFSQQPRNRDDVLLHEELTLVIRSTLVEFL
jgi:hypothetical protein